MTIDFDSEALIHFAEAAREFPKPPCLQTLHRWRLRGVRGVKLETILIGGLRYTSREAIRRFISAQNAGNAPTPLVMTPSRRQRQAEAAMTALKAMGVGN